MQGGFILYISLAGALVLVSMVCIAFISYYLVKVLREAYFILSSNKDNINSLLSYIPKIIPKTEESSNEDNSDIYKDIISTAALVVKKLVSEKEKKEN